MQFEAAGTFKSCGNAGLPKIRAFSTMLFLVTTGLCLLFVWQRGLWSCHQSLQHLRISLVATVLYLGGKLAGWLPTPPFFTMGETRRYPPSNAKAPRSHYLWASSLGGYLQWISPSALCPAWVTKSHPGEGDSSCSHMPQLRAHCVSCFVLLHPKVARILLPSRTSPI